MQESMVGESSPGGLPTKLMGSGDDGMLPVALFRLLMVIGPTDGAPWGIMTFRYLDVTALAHK